MNRGYSTQGTNLILYYSMPIPRDFFLFIFFKHIQEGDENQVKLSE